MEPLVFRTAQALSKKVVGFAFGIALVAAVSSDAEAQKVRKARLLEDPVTFMRLQPADIVDAILEDVNQLTYPPDRSRTVLQEIIPDSVQFPCMVSEDAPTKWRSEKRPTSVHKLRPGDIDVIAAIGDSLTTGNSAREISSIGAVIQDRGVSFTGGGSGTWRSITTLPNILKIFNPKLLGYAVGRGDFFSYNAQLNVAIPAAMDDDIMDQVNLFMKKIKEDRRIDFKNDWKLLSIMIGDNDICSYQCYDRKKHSPEAHKFHLQRALDYLYNNVPRLFVNVISIIDPTASARVSDSTICGIFRRVFCACFYHYSDNKEGIAKIAAEVVKYQEAERELIYSGRYEGREDFTVELQPFFEVVNAPKNPGEPEHERILHWLQTELPVWTPECFHLNQRGLAAVSIQLWNNMVEPAWNKTNRIEDIMVNEYKCLKSNAPYLFTKKNSEDYFKFGHQ